MLMYGSIFVPLLMLIEERPNASRLLLGFGISLGVILFTSILFGPKLVAIFTGEANSTFLKGNETNVSMFETDMANTNATKNEPSKNKPTISRNSNLRNSLRKDNTLGLPVLPAFTVNIIPDNRVHPS